MKFVALVTTLILIAPLSANAEDIGFSYQSSDGTIYTSTTAPAYCKKYYDRTPGIASGMTPSGCLDPQFTTSRGKPRKGSLPDKGAYVDQEDDSYVSKRERRQKRSEKKWWDMRTWGQDEAQDEEITLIEKDEGKKQGRIEGRLPPAPGSRSQSRSRTRIVEKEETIELTPVLPGDDDDSGQEKKSKRVVGRVPPAPRVLEKQEIELQIGTGEGDGEKKGGKLTGRVPRPPMPIPPPSDDDDSGKDDGKKNGKITGRLPPRPPMPIPLPPPSDDDSGKSTGKKEGRIVGKIPAAPKRSGEAPIPLPKRKPVVKVKPPVDIEQGKDEGKKEGRIVGVVPPAPPPSGEDDGDDDGDGKKGSGRVVGRIPMPPRVVPITPPSDDDGGGKKTGKVIGRVPPTPAEVPIMPPPLEQDKSKMGKITGRMPAAPNRVIERDRDGTNITELKKNLKPITIIPPSGKVPVLKSSQDHRVVRVSGPESCFEGLSPTELVELAPFIREYNRQYAEKNPAATPAADPELLAQVKQRTPAQEACAAEAPESPSRAVLAFDSFNTFDYKEHYKEKGAELPEAEADAFEKGNAISAAARREDRSVAGVHWKYYARETEEKEELSPAVRCAYELATKGYKTLSGKTVYNTIALVGHSFGGDAAYKVANTLRKLGVRVDLVLTTDPRQPLNTANRVNFTKPATVDRWVNFYQRNDPVLKGFSIDGASNVDISETGAWHGQSAHTDQVRQRASSEVAGLPLCKGSLSTSVYKQGKASCE